MSGERDNSGPYNGSVGFASGSSTSQEAAELADFAGSLRGFVLDAIRRSGDYGATRGELHRLFGKKYQESTVGARIRELTKDGLLRDSGAVRLDPDTNRNHTVWVIAKVPTVRWDGEKWVEA